MSTPQPQQEFDFYINQKKPTLGLYVKKGAALSDFSENEAADWSLSGHVWQDQIAAPLLAEIEVNGHAFQELRQA